MNPRRSRVPSEHARIRVEDLGCRRGGRLLFTGLGFALDAGQAALVTGANGVGKSSLLRLLGGLLPHYAGTMDIAGPVALADDRLALDGDRTLGQALAFWASMDGGDAAAALAAFALDDLSAVPVRMLSTGQRKRATLARVMASGAPIWLLDEPANGLDADAVARLGAAVASHVGQGGIVIATSHQPLPWQADITLALVPPSDGEWDAP